MCGQAKPDPQSGHRFEGVLYFILIYSRVISADLQGQLPIFTDEQDQDLFLCTGSGVDIYQDILPVVRLAFEFPAEHLAQAARRDQAELAFLYVQQLADRAARLLSGELGADDLPVDMVGQEDIRAMLKEIQYGNCDISEWNGSETNSLPELNGFWLESSLEISPKQQVVTLNYIFSSENNFNADNLEELKSIMYIAEFDNGCLYGKTGSGTDGKAWFVGFIEENDNKIYFAIYLDDVQNKEAVSGNKAKEIAISILNSEV